MAKLGPVAPEPAPIAPKRAPENTVGVIPSAEMNRTPDRPSIGVVPPSEVVVSVTPQTPGGPTFGVVSNIVSAAPPPPPPPKPIGVIEPEAAFPPAYVAPVPKVGQVKDRVVTPAPVAANLPEKPGADRPLVEIPNVVNPLAPKDDDKRK